VRRPTAKEDIMSTEEKKPEEKQRQCPCCDVIKLASDEKQPISLIEAVAIGASIGALAGNLQLVSGAMCEKHMLPWLLSCLSGIERLERLLAARDGAEAPKGQPDRSLS
jgi:hypothetical protein